MENQDFWTLKVAETKTQDHNGSRVEIKKSIDAVVHALTTLKGGEQMYRLRFSQGRPLGLKRIKSNRIQMDAADNQLCKELESEAYSNEYG